MNGTIVLFIIAFAIVAFLFGPFLTIWAINTLFGLSIAYTLKTWFAVIILVSAARANVTVNKS